MTTSPHAHRLPPQRLRKAGLQPIEDSFRQYSTVLSKAATHFARLRTALQPEDRPTLAQLRAAQYVVRNSTTKGPYAGAELRPFDGRPGAMDAFERPSRVGDRLFYRGGRVEVVA